MSGDVNRIEGIIQFRITGRGSECEPMLEGIVLLKDGCVNQEEGAQGPIFEPKTLSSYFKKNDEK